MQRRLCPARRVQRRRARHNRRLKLPASGRSGRESHSPNPNSPYLRNWKIGRTTDIGSCDPQGFGNTLGWLWPARLNAGWRTIEECGNRMREPPPTGGLKKISCVISENRAQKGRARLSWMVPTEGVEPTHSHEY